MPRPLGSAINRMNTPSPAPPFCAWAVRGTRRFLPSTCTWGVDLLTLQHLNFQASLT